MNTMQIYKAMSDEDKQALRELQEEESARLGRKVPLSEMLAAVTPGM